MKKLVQITTAILLFGLTAFQTHAAFSSLYVFGDALSATADGTGSSLYYTNRDCNGRVWIEVLAQRQGLVYDASKNISYYDHNSGEVLADVNKLPFNPDYSTSLFILWVCNADTFDAAQYHDSPAQWTIDTATSQANHLQIIKNLYAKGVRTLIMPNAVDISEIPAYNRAASAKTMHDGCVAYNAALSNTINQAKASCPGLTIYTPDYFTLLNNVLTNAAFYGLTNALYQGYSIDALDGLYGGAQTVPLNGAGSNYIFWDTQDPTAKLHEIMADVAQQIISPVQISNLALLNGSNRLDVVNYPAGLNGFVDGSTNLSLPWTTVTNIVSSGTAQSFLVVAPVLPPSVPASGTGGSTDPNNPTPGTYNPPFNPAQFYRLRFPYAWNWP